jgi:hypothetical protein
MEAPKAATVDGKTVRMVPKKEAIENTVEIRRANGRPYVLATRFLKPLGFDGTKALDIEACGPQKQRARLSGLLHQAILMMQAAKHRRLHNAVTGWHLLPVVARRNLALVGFRRSRAE